MKKQSRKSLTLSRETVHMLNGQLKMAGGYYTQITCDNSCNSVPGSHCFDCSMTGPTLC